MKKYILLPVLYLIYNFTIKAQTYTVESITYNLPFDMNQITHNGSLDDMWNSVVNLPFDFNFFGINYNQISVSGNGVLSFDTSIVNTFHSWVLGSEDTTILSLPGTGGALTNGNIFFACHDLLSGGGNNVLGYQVFGNAPNRIFVVSISDAPHFACSSLTTTQALVMFESTNVIEVYISDKPICDNWNGEGLAVLGIQNEDASVAYFPVGRNTSIWTAQNEAWRFTPEVLSIDENNFFQFKIYPNPAIDYMTLDFPVEFKNSTIEIIDIHGKVVLKQDYVEKTLDVSQFASGVYFLKINSDLGEKVFKLVIK